MILEEFYTMTNVTAIFGRQYSGPIFISLSGLFYAPKKRKGRSCLISCFLKSATLVHYVAVPTV